MKMYSDDAGIQRLWSHELSSQSYYELDIAKEIEKIQMNSDHQKQQ
jgi:hypothetical protein